MQEPSGPSAEDEISRKITTELHMETVTTLVRVLSDEVSALEDSSSTLTVEVRDLMKLV